VLELIGIISQEINIV